MSSFTMFTNTFRRPGVSGRRGSILAYLALLLVMFAAVATLAVDYGHIQFVKSQMQRTADAAARGYMVYYNLYGLAFANAHGPALYSSANNPIDANSGTSPSVTVTWGYWTGATSTFSTSSGTVRAVQVTITRTKSGGNPLPLFWGGMIGFLSCDVHASAIAAQVVSSQSGIFVPAVGDPWLAGEPTGTMGSQTDPQFQGQGVNADHPWQHDYAGPVGGHMADGQPYSSPVQVSLPITPGSVITITNVTGTGAHDDKDVGANADGVEGGTTNPIYDDVASNGVSEHGMSDVSMPIDSMAAVFLASNLPDDNTAPPPLDFSTQAERDYTYLSPQAQQPFFVGNGQTSSGVQQAIVVPPNATRLFLGMMDGQEWDNNLNGYHATITQTGVVLVQ